MKETQVPLTVWLGQKEFRERYGAEAGGVQLLFYSHLKDTHNNEQLGQCILIGGRCEIIKC